MQTPDFAIVGAPKCGTTALYTYLSAHPGVSMSARKEPHFWSSDIPRAWQVTDPAVYASLWADALPGTLRGEASPEYLRSHLAIPRLLAERPDVRLIAMIRNPVDLVASLHSNNLLGFQEDVRDFEAAWRLQGRRQQGESLPPECTEPVLLQYAAYGSIGDQLERFMALVPAAQRVVIVLDDLRTDPRGQYRRVLDLLGLADDGRTDFAPVHVNRALRSAGFVQLHRSLPRRLGPFYAPARAAVRAVGIRPSALVERFKYRTAPRKPLRAGFEAELIATFLPQIAKIERVLDRDLASWTKPSRLRSG